MRPPRITARVIHRIRSSICGAESVGGRPPQSAGFLISRTQ